MSDSVKHMAASGAESARLLVVSREPEALRSLWAVQEANAWEIDITGSGCEALEKVQSGAGPQLVVLDLAKGDADGLYTLRWLRRVRPEMPIVLLSESDDAEQKIEAMRLGADDYLVRPVDPQQLQAVVRRYVTGAGDGGTEEIASEQVEQISEDLYFIAASPVMRKLRAQAELLAQVDVPVLIVGERGSGKESTARLIHKLSVRSGFRFRKINCGALPPDLLERELFGLDSGAVRATGGKPELADKGSVLLDDVADTPASVQGRLLEILQEKQLSRLAGGDARVDGDVRILAATSSNLDEALAEHQLREDLYYRLSAFTVHVPPLRQRKEEIPLLLGHFMKQLGRRYGLPTRTLSPALLDACKVHSWPGNLRELESFVKRYLVTGDEELALNELAQGLEMLSERGSPGWQTGLRDGHAAVESEEPSSGLRSLVQSVKGETERNAIAVALEQTHWNRKAAARLLKVSYRTLLYKIQQYHMSPPSHYVPAALVGQGAKGNGDGR